MTPRTSMTLTNMPATAKRALCEIPVVLEKEFPAAEEGLDHAPGVAVICTRHSTTWRAGFNDARPGERTAQKN